MPAASVAADATTEAMAQVVFLAASGLGLGLTQFRHLEGAASFDPAACWRCCCWRFLPSRC